PSGPGAIGLRGSVRATDGAHAASKDGFTAVPRRPIAPSPPTAEAQTFVTNGPARRTTARVPPPTSRAPRWIGGRAADASAGLLRGSGARGRAAALEVPLVREAQDRVLRLDRVRQRLERRGEPQDRQRRLI